MYTLNATFDAHVDQEQVLTAVLEALPEGSHATLQREPILLDVSDLGPEHVGSSIRAKIGTGDEFGGELTAVAPNYAGGMMVIVNGKSHILGSWDTVQVLPPVSEGDHTPDEPEEAEVEEFDLTPETFDDALELVMKTEFAVRNHLVSLGSLTRGQFETVANRPLTDYEFGLVSGSVRTHVATMLDTIIGALVARHIDTLSILGLSEEGEE